MNDERLAYLALALTPGIGPARLESLGQTFGSWTGARAAPFAHLCAAPRMNRAAATAIRQTSLDAVDRLVRAVDALGATVLVPDDPAFPARLRPIADPPTVLFAQGNLALLEPDAVAIVGSRHPTGYGVGVTREIGQVAAQAGLVVVSGMARGLDAVAHWAALEAGGGTIGVLGNGLGVVYPAVNATLYDRVSRAGLLLTEYPPGERPNAGSFPRRNRLISGLARVVVVVEAARKSGAIVTADQAVAQGRDVLAVPGPIRSRLSEGVNRLIRSGAGPLLEPDDLLAHYPSIAPAVRARFRPDAEPDVQLRRLEREQRRVFELLDAVPRDADRIGAEAGLSPGEVMAAITELELAGLVDRTAAGFVRA